MLSMLLTFFWKDRLGFKLVMEYRHCNFLTVIFEKNILVCRNIEISFVVLRKQKIYVQIMVGV